MTTEATQTEKPQDVVFINYEKDEDGKKTDKIKSYSVVDGDKSYIAYPAPVFVANYDSADKENESLRGQEQCRIESISPKKGRERFSVTVNWPTDQEGVTETAKYIAVQRIGKDGKPTEFFSVSNEIDKDGKITFPESPKNKDEKGPANFLQRKLTKGGQAYMSAIIDDQKAGMCFKVSEGTVYEVGQEGEKSRKKQNASFRLVVSTDPETGKPKGERFILQIGETQTAFWRKCDENGVFGGAYKKMTNERKVEKTAEAEVPEVMAEEVAPKRRGRTKA